MSNSNRATTPPKSGFRPLIGCIANLISQHRATRWVERVMPPQSLAKVGLLYSHESFDYSMWVDSISTLDALDVPGALSVTVQRRGLDEN